MSIKKRVCRILEIEQLDNDVFSMWIEDEQMDYDVIPGQFLSLFCKSGERLLPRPISICEVDHMARTIRLVYRTVGEGTREFSTLKIEDEVWIMGPLGNGYDIKHELKYKNPIVIGGGIGIPPLLQLVKELHKKEKECKVLLGYRSGSFLEKEFEAYTSVYVATEDGSVGIKGNVMKLLESENIKGDVIYACGPTRMLQEVKGYAIKNGIKAYLSLEERMACGIGACYACVCKSVDKDKYTQVENKRICKEGPVFDSEEILL